jgi:uncharacterized protein (TIGR02246 family)
MLQCQRQTSQISESGGPISQERRKGATMKVLFPSLTCLVLCLTAFAHSAENETPVRQAVQAFYTAFDRGFLDGASAFATEDWNHINPFGGRTRGREAVLKEVVEVHTTFLRGVTDTIENVDIRFATPDVAVATVTSRVSTFTPPDGITHENERWIRTFVVVKREGRWLIMQDQNTIIR